MMYSRAYIWENALLGTDKWLCIMYSIIKYIFYEAYIVIVFLAILIINNDY